MSSDFALRIQGLNKIYRIRHQENHGTLAETVLHRLRHRGAPESQEDFRALKDVTLDVAQGEVLGVIGHNGAGKSTLLKILSRITPPTSGRIDVFGRIGSLLEVGTGFHPELTGRENVYLNGSILGMKRREIEGLFDEIVEFSGVGRFLDTPVKRYSSGMYVRLAFAVAAHLRTEILLLDEVLAVGDPDFQRRSVAQIKRLAHDGRTVLFVSHSRELVEELTSTAVAFEDGAIVDRGPTRQVLERRHRRPVREARFSRNHGLGTETRFNAINAHAERADDGRARILIDLEVATTAKCPRWRANFTLHSPGGAAIGNSFGPVQPALSSPGTCSATIATEPLPLAPGTYSMDLSLSVEGKDPGTFELVDLVTDACVFVIPDLKEGAWLPQWGFLNIASVST